MKSLLLAFLVLLSIHAYGQNDALTNADIIKLTKLDLPPSAIIAKIKNSPTHFDVSVDALIALKNQGVNGDVVSEMITANSQEKKEVASQKDYRDPRTMRKEGIYYYNRSDTSNLFVPIDPTVVSSSKSGGFGTHVAQSYTYGIAKNKERSELSGAHARRQIAHTRPRFYFYLDPQKSISPNEFALVRLTEHKNSREMIVGTTNAYGRSTGIDEKEKVDFNYDQVADGVYKVYPQEPLDDGEYCFVYTGSTPTIFSQNQVYDFGINTEQ